MADRANVHAVEALAGFRPAVVEFIDACRAALTGAEADALRTVSYINENRAPHWKREVRRRQDELNRAKSELIRAQARKQGDERSTFDERKAVDKARRRLEIAEQKLAACKVWVRRLEKEQVKFLGEIQALKQIVNHDMELALANLDRMIGALDAYTRIRLERTRPAADGGEGEGR